MQDDTSAGRRSPLRPSRVLGSDPHDFAGLYLRHRIIVHLARPPLPAGPARRGRGGAGGLPAAVPRHARARDRAAGVGVLPPHHHEPLHRPLPRGRPPAAPGRARGRAARGARRGRPGRPGRPGGGRGARARGPVEAARLHRAALVMREIEEKPLPVIAAELASPRTASSTCSSGPAGRCASCSAARPSRRRRRRAAGPLAARRLGGAAGLLLLALLGLGTGPTCAPCPSSASTCPTCSA